MTIKTDLGYIDITNEVLAGIAGCTQHPPASVSKA